MRGKKTAKKEKPVTRYLFTKVSRRERIDDGKNCYRFRGDHRRILMVECFDIVPTEFDVDGFFMMSPYLRLLFSSSICRRLILAPDSMAAATMAPATNRGTPNTNSRCVNSLTPPVTSSTKPYTTVTIIEYATALRQKSRRKFGGSKSGLVILKCSPNVTDQQKPRCCPERL
jgi:hypothetical protein